jgi:hypothetical protein
MILFRRIKATIILEKTDISIFKPAQLNGFIGLIDIIIEFFVETPQYARILV